MPALDREGIFRAAVKRWHVETSKQSKAVAVAIEFLILEQLDGNDWRSWSDYEDHTTWGRWYVINGKGLPNETAVLQLSESLGWVGGLRQVAEEPPPAGVVVQITVKGEQYDGRVRYRAEWMNPGDYVPGPSGASADTVRGLSTQYDSLLRAAAAGGKKKAAPAPTRAPAPAPAPRKVEPLPPDQIPF